MNDQRWTLTKEEAARGRVPDGIRCTLQFGNLCIVFGRLEGVPAVRVAAKIFPDLRPRQ